MRWLLLIPVVVGCGFSPQERACLAKVEAHEDAEFAACGDATDGECSTDAIMDRHDAAAERCAR